MPSDLRSIVTALKKAQLEFDRLLFDEALQHDIGEPCSEDQMARLQSILGHPPPRTYLDFMTLHNGWLNFCGDAKILAVEDYGSHWLERRKEELSVLFYETALDPFAAGCFPIMLGENSETFLLLDRNENGAYREGEYALFDLTSKRKVFGRFDEFLEFRLDVLRRVIDAERNGWPD